jgi:hypothetical protein
MVDPTFLVIGAAIFFIVLILILRSGAKEEPLKPTLSKKDKQKQKQQLAKQQKPKKGRSALKKSERSGIASEWQVVDSAAKDATEVLEFLKGKDPNELAKQQAGPTKQAAKRKGKKAKEEVQSSEDSATDDGSLEGFEQVKKKAPADKKKKKKEKKQEEVKDIAPKPYFRPLNPDGTPIKEEKPKKGERKPRVDGHRPRIPREGGDAEGQGERKPRPEGERRERKPRPEGEQREGEEERKPREPRPPKEPREVRRPITSPPNVKYEEADLNDILNSITEDYKSKPKPPREPRESRTSARASSLFSKIQRNVLIQLLGKLEARDLVALSGVNHHLLFAARKDSLWKELLFRDFGVKDLRQTKSFRVAYIVEYKKKHNKGGKKDEAAVPQGEEKDAKAKNQKKAQGSKEAAKE